MPLIVGDPRDPHVAAVAQLLTTAPVIIDAATWATAPVTLDTNGLRVAGTKALPGRGWIRRLAPAGWNVPLPREDAAASAERSAALSGLAAVVRLTEIEWLSPVEALGAAENKPHQYRLLHQVGIAIPGWVVTTDPAAAPVDNGWVAKPLGSGTFGDAAGIGYVVPTTAFDPGQSAALAGAPFLLQQRVIAAAHARIVTVGSSAFSGTLPATGLPLDWRMDAAAHHSFTDQPAPDEVCELAVMAASTLGVGYSSQDWICDTDGGWWFIDLNPAGQWLFLPTGPATGVTAAVAAFLNEGR
ncbi:hypothetical protein [Nocardioides sp. Iso805N]|uniref:hypothetical protein n=1 Tax=Nocardioides sp. Iso805N TaxID=1283287 RepID=UPI0012FC69EA|nr:hypothetical protein [Nocardioides sp. Iso805N]